MSVKLVKSRSGFTILEVMIALGVVSVFVLLSMNNSSTQSTNLQLNRTSATKDRILSGIRGLAGLPASIRNSMRAEAMNGTCPANPELYSCINGPYTGAGCPVAAKCQSGLVFPFTLYAPQVELIPLAVMPITSPSGSPSASMYDTFGSPCTQANAGCPLEVFTSFQAQCGPAPVVIGGAPTAAQLAPLPTCTVADVIQVNYTVQLVPSLSAQYPALAVFVGGITGSVSVRVKDISNNDPAP